MYCLYKWFRSLISGQLLHTERFFRTINEYNIKDFSDVTDGSDVQALGSDGTTNHFRCHSQVRFRTSEERAKLRYYRNKCLIYVSNANTQM